MFFFFHVKMAEKIVDVSIHLNMYNFRATHSECQKQKSYTLVCLFINFEHLKHQNKLSLQKA